MRACGGAVQGVIERRLPLDTETTFNRQVDGMTFMSEGSWAQAPVQLLSGEQTESPDAFGLAVCLHPREVRERRRLLLVVIAGALEAVDVAIEGSSSAPLPSAVDTLLTPRLQMVTNVDAWSGGATEQRLIGRPPEGSAWNNPRVSWSSEELRVAGGLPLLPPRGAGVTFLPGGCWVRVADERSSAGGLSVECGSVSVEAAEIAALEHVYSAKGALSRVSLRTLTATEEGA